MLKRFILGFVVLALALAGYFWWASRPGNYANFPPVARGPWVAFGDSLTEGFGAGPGQDYPALLGQHLGVPILNMGRSGDTTADGLRRVEEVARLRPRVVLLCLGGNDSLQGERATVTFSNLGQIIDRLKERGTFVVLIGVHSASLRDRKEQGFANLAREKNVFYIPDILRGVLFNPAFMSDAVHPNEEGYKRIAARLKNSIEPLIPRLKALGDAAGP